MWKKKKNIAKDEETENSIQVSISNCINASHKSN